MIGVVEAIGIATEAIMKRVNTLLDNFLPRTGGTMTGNVKVQGNDFVISHTTDEISKRTILQGGDDWYGGASLYLNGSDSEYNSGSSKGNFMLYAHNGTINSCLEGKPDGTLLWKNKSLYGEYNKPTAQDVGALPISGGTMTGYPLVDTQNSFCAIAKRRVINDILYETRFGLGGTIGADNIGKGAASLEVADASDTNNDGQPDYSIIARLDVGSHGIQYRGNNATNGSTIMLYDENGNGRVGGERIYMANDCGITLANNNMIKLISQNSQATNLDEFRALTVQNPKYQTNVKNSLLFQEKLAGKEPVAYRIYGEHNKPTPEDIGALPTGKIIPSGADFNNYNEVGIYVGAAALGNGTTFNYSNSPSAVSAAFLLEVLPTGNGAHRMQRITLCSKGYSRKWERHLHSNAWGEWFCTYADRNTLLWSGAEQMGVDTTIELAEPISKQPTGIVLVFSYYSDTNGAQDYQYHTFFKSKYEIGVLGALNNGNGVGHQFMLSNATFSVMGTKYLYISDSKILGNENNTVVGTSATTGITYDNNRYVLRYVIGI